MADLDTTNPLAIVSAFFLTMLTAIMFLVRIISVVVIAPLAGVVFGIGMFGIFFYIFGSKDK